MSKQPFDPYIADALSRLEQVAQELDRTKRASLYAQLAERYSQLHMYGRAIEMYKKSLAACDNYEDSWKVRRNLAELLIRIYGEDGFEDARVQTRDYVPLQWPIELEIEHKQAAIERHRQKTALDQDYPALKAIVGESRNIMEICQKIITYAASSAPVLITGDSGTGKEVVARALAEISGRQFIPFNCGAVAEGVLESDLFGHVKGAFTDARTDKQGLFETPGDSVIFLDEIGEASQKFQAALLRVIDNREVQRVGDPHIRMLTGSKKVVCATAKDLEEEMNAKTFREDLFHRISGLTIYCEPLEKRPEDIRLLVRHFLATDPELQQSGPFSEYAVDYWITWVYLAERYAEALISGETEPQSMEIPPLKGNIRGLREHVRRAVLEDKLTKYEEAPFEDRWGALNYTKEEIERYDWTIALDGCPLQKDAGRLMGIDDKKKVSKILEPLGLMKKQRKKQGPQA